MTDWTEEAHWTTKAGVEYQIEERFNRSTDLYELRFSQKAGDHWFVRDRWESKAGWCPDE